MHLLIAPNAFKNSLTAGEAAKALQQGLENSRLKATTECFPVGDGGDGTGDLLIERLGGHSIETEARDPFGRKRMTRWGLADNGRTAVIEMASASGLRLLDTRELDPLKATSRGTGDLIHAALDQPNRLQRIILGMGGSATVDGGVGILEALGIRFLNGKGQPLTNLPESLVDLSRIDSSGLDPRLADVELTVLCDVDNPLLGLQGAAAVFGPQKGASPEAVQRLEAALVQFARVVSQQTGKVLSDLPRGGTAGGAAAGLYGLLSARLVNGIDYFLEITGFEEALNRSDWVITGEGSIDQQTLQGKGPFGVASLAKKKGIPVIGLAGSVPAEAAPALQEYFDVLLAIGHGPSTLEEAMRHTPGDLLRTALQLGNLLAAAPRCRVAKD
jgi:glycerate kinase